MNSVARIAVLAGVVSVIQALTAGCRAPGVPQPELEREPVPLQADPAELTWWQDAKFGLFIHWGPVSLKGAELSWSRWGPRPGREPAQSGIPAEQYDQLYKQFNPTAFNADEWVALAKAAGMRYLIFTTKHHDGFCMFDTRWTDYNIMHSPFGRDICAELAAACHEAGLKLGWYYSPPDWHHPDYRNPATHDRYITFLHGQLRELCTHYGKVDIIWFDGLGGTAEDWDARRLVREIRRLQPGVLINNRAGLPCDFDTPEQQIGRFETRRPWESCITIGTQWSYKPHDRTKSLAQCAKMLVKTVGGGGNLLLNVGPMPTGQIDPEQAARLREIGRWLKPIGESIYGTRGGPFRPGPWGAATHRGRRVYVHILNWMAPTIILPAIDAKIVSARLLNGEKVAVRQTNDGITIDVPPALRDVVDTVVVLDVDRPADAVTVAPYRSGSLAFGRPVTTAKVARERPGEGGARAVDDDFSTCWVCRAGPGRQWLAVDLGQPRRIAGVAVAEGGLDRVKRFAVQYRKGDRWVTLAEGGTIGDFKRVDFPPVEARHVRLEILKTAGRPLIAEFQVFGPR